MCGLSEKEKNKEKKLEENLKSIFKAQLEVYEYWEIDECIRFLFKLSDRDE